MPFRPGRTFYDMYGNKYIITKVTGNAVAFHFFPLTQDELVNILQISKQKLNQCFKDRFYTWGEREN